MAVLDTLELLLPALDAYIETTQKPRLVTIKGLGDVYIRDLKVKDINAQIADTTDKKDLRANARGVCRLLAKADGSRLMDPDNPEHVDRMMEVPLRFLVKINASVDLDEKAEAEGN